MGRVAPHAADWALANGASDALLALRDAGARVRALASRVASAAAVTRARTKLATSAAEDGEATSVLAALVAETRRLLRLGRARKPMRLSRTRSF